MTFRTPMIAAAAVMFSTSLLAQNAPKLKVGLMLPYTGTYASLGNAIENGFKLYLSEQGNKFSGREVEFFKVDDESDPSKATDNVNKLVKRDNVDVLIGSVHSGVAMAMAKVAKDNGTLLIVPNAGADAVTGPMCAPNIFRTSFSNWQPGYAMGNVMAAKGLKKVVTITWKYAAGDESVRGFKEGFEKGGGSVVNFYSIQAQTGAWLDADYIVNKAALLGLTRSAANEWGRFNIRVNAIAPTAAGAAYLQWAAENPDFAAQSAASKPLGRIGDPEADIAPVVLFLASEMSRYVTGELIHVDGGLHMPGHNSRPDNIPELEAQGRAAAG